MSHKLLNFSQFVNEALFSGDSNASQLTAQGGGENKVASEGLKLDNALIASTPAAATFYIEQKTITSGNYTWDLTGVEGMETDWSYYDGIRTKILYDGEIAVDAFDKLNSQLNFVKTELGHDISKIQISDVDPKSLWLLYVGRENLTIFVYTSKSKKAKTHVFMPKLSRDQKKVDATKYKIPPLSGLPAEILNDATGTFNGTSASPTQLEIEGKKAIYNITTSLGIGRIPEFYCFVGSDQEYAMSLGVKEMKKGSKYFVIKGKANNDSNVLFYEKKDGTASFIKFTEATWDSRKKV
jgi:hypothetical protein